MPRLERHGDMPRSQSLKWSYDPPSSNANASPNYSSSVKSTLGPPSPASWSAPSVNSLLPPYASYPSGSIPLSPLYRSQEGSQVVNVNQNGKGHKRHSITSPDFLDWKRLHLSRAKLMITPKVAAIMAGFSVVSTVELQINDDAEPILLTAFTVTTTLLVCTTMLSIMISTCILPHIQVVAQLNPTLEARESPHDLMIWYIDLSWVLANTFSVFLFTLDVILLCWIKFTYFSVTASVCATVILSAALIGIIVFAVVFFRKIVKHQYLISHQRYEQLEEMQRQLELSSSVLNL